MKPIDLNPTIAFSKNEKLRRLWDKWMLPSHRLFGIGSTDYTFEFVFFANTVIGDIGQQQAQYLENIWCFEATT